MRMDVGRLIETDGIALYVTEAGEGPPVLLCHGFPELGYSWRHQIPALVEAGYRVLVPDMRGFGRSSRPDDVESYSVARIAGDLHAILDDIGVEQAVFIGHDWGAEIVWNLSVLAPERMAAVAGLSIPFRPRGPVPPTELLRSLFGDSFFYLLYVQEPGVADAELNADPAETIRRFIAAGDNETGGMAKLGANMSASTSPGLLDRLPPSSPLPSWMSEVEASVFVDSYQRTGFTGGLNYYRNFDRNWELLEPVGSAQVRMPAAFLTGSDDVGALLPMAGPEWVPDLRVDATVADAGHWLHQQRPAEVNRYLLEFLSGLDRRGGTWR